MRESGLEEYSKRKMGDGFLLFLFSTKGKHTDSIKEKRRKTI